MSHTVHFHESPILIVGAGPAGLILALQLARHGTPCMLVERSVETTRWPKMDITNCRSMEIFRKLGIADEYRAQGVGQEWPFDVLFSTGLSQGGRALAKWNLPSPNVYRDIIRANNDGTMPREPRNPFVSSRFGFRFETLVERDTGIESALADTGTGDRHIVKSAYVVGCDDASSRVRETVGINLLGRPS
ncbi:FAD-dependent monooxygenase apdD [Colletotrichum spinosum]|uniref:FAD-dependent monooxygenase apdD n=1 Tax=Colletotrichum spinosum TaxID=1347390 RepID=A0A4R8QJX1_9PEZI|nr:FAD-dependent monooxygenase apdD [Colletotrichum spinosum]